MLGREQNILGTIGEREGRFGSQTSGTEMG